VKFKKTPDIIGGMQIISWFLPDIFQRQLHNHLHFELFLTHLSILKAQKLRLLSHVTRATKNSKGAVFGKSVMFVTPVLIPPQLY
jgi:hypothetical protein